MIKSRIAPWRILLPISIATALSLLGDSALYTILPTHTAEAGVTLAGVGLLLSANRWIRLISNGVVGRLIDQIGRKQIFVTALFLGALSTALYALTLPYWLFVASRILWGISWSGIWIGGNALVLGIGDGTHRGRYVSLYTVAYVIGAGTGALLGGWLTDLVGYASTMGIHAAFQLVGALVALIFLPSQAAPAAPTLSTKTAEKTPKAAPQPIAYRQIVTVLALLGVSRLVQSGMIVPTFGLFLTERFGEAVEIFGRTYGITTLNGFALSTTIYLSLLTTTASGELSDRWNSRWRVALISLCIGVIGALVLAFAQSGLVLIGLLLVALAAGGCTSLATMLIGDLTATSQQGRGLGMLFNIGDLSSAAGPLIVFQLLTFVPITTLYLAGAILFSIVALGALQQVRVEHIRF